MAKSIILVQKQIYFDTSAKKIKRKVDIVNFVPCQHEPKSITGRWKKTKKVWREFLFSDF